MVVSSNKKGSDCISIPIIRITFERRYERALNATRGSSVRKGAAFGLLMGWTFLILYSIYPLGFIIGSLLIRHEGVDKLNISDIIVVSDLAVNHHTNHMFISSRR